VLATGSDALLPRHTPGHDAAGVFVYRTIEDLQKLIDYSAQKKGTVGVVVGGGLLGLEAAKAMIDLEAFEKVKLIERNRWVLSRQLDSDAGGLVVEQVRDLGLDVLLSKRVGKIEVTEENAVKGVVFEDGEKMECSTICFAIGIKGVGSSLVRIYARVRRTYMPSESARVGRIRRLVSLLLVLRWRKFFLSTLRKPRSTRIGSSRDRISAPS
jgi:NAD(P)H-nitrite reductase large subunit